MKSWVKAKCQRLSQTEGCCEVCKQPITGLVIGHHIKNRSQKGRNTIDNLELRCTDCEKYCHEKFKFGNIPEGKREEVMLTMRRLKEENMVYVTLHDPDMVKVTRGLQVLGNDTPAKISKVLGISEAYAKNLLDESTRAWMDEMRLHAEQARAAA